MLHKLVFSTEDVESIQDSHSVGAYVRSGESGALVTHHGYEEAGSTTFAFLDADVTVGTDSINETAHGLSTGDRVQLTTDGTLPAGLALATDYYVIRVDADNIQFAATAIDAEEGTAVIITAAAGTGTHTVTEQEKDGRALDVYITNPIDITATDLDIRDLTAVSDSVESWTHYGSGTSITSSVNGGDTGLDVNVINASDIEVAVNSEYAEDSAHISGDIGSLGLAVRQDTLAASVDTDGDYAALKVDAVGALYTRITNTITTSDSALANTAIATNVNTLGAANTAEDVVVAPLADRKYLLVMNNDNRSIYIGQSGVTAANGFPIPNGSMLTFRAGAAVDIEWVSTKLNHDIRTLELS